MSKLHCYLRANRDKIIILFFGFLYLLIVLNTPYRSDDAWVHRQIIDQSFTFESWLKSVKLFWVSFMTDQSRLPTQVFLDTLVFFFLRNRVIYKLFLVLGTLSCSFLSGKLVKYLSDSTKLQLLVILFSFLPFQFYLEHNSLTQYYLLAQSILIFSLIALILYIRYSNGIERNYIKFLSVAFWAIACAIYEVIYPFCIIFTIVGYKKYKNLRLSLKSTWIYFIVVAIFAGVNIIIRILYPPLAPSVSFSWDLFGILRAFCFQFIAGIPLSTHFAQNNVIIQPSLYRMLQNIVVEDLLFALIYVFLFGYIVKKYKVHSKRNNYIAYLYVGAIGLIIWSIPPAIYSLSKQYQEWLEMGKGYLGVVIEYFGFAMLLGSVYLLLDIWVRKKMGGGDMQTIKLVYGNIIFCDYTSCAY